MSSATKRDHLPHEIQISYCPRVSRSACPRRASPLISDRACTRRSIVYQIRCSGGQLHADRTCLLSGSLIDASDVSPHVSGMLKAWGPVRRGSGARLLGHAGRDRDRDVTAVGLSWVCHTIWSRVSAMGADFELALGFRTRGAGVPRFSCSQRSSRSSRFNGPLSDREADLSCACQIGPASVSRSRVSARIARPYRPLACARSHPLAPLVSANGQLSPPRT